MRELTELLQTTIYLRRNNTRAYNWLLGPKTSTLSTTSAGESDLCGTSSAPSATIFLTKLPKSNALQIMNLMRLVMSEPENAAACIKISDVTPDLQGTPVFLTGPTDLPNLIEMDACPRNYYTRTLLVCYI